MLAIPCREACTDPTCAGTPAVLCRTHRLTVPVLICVELFSLNPCDAINDPRSAPPPVPPGPHNVEMSLQFRRARREDVPAVVDLLRDDAIAAEREQHDRPVDDVYSRAFDAIDADQRQLLAVAELDGEIVGTLQLTFIPYLTYQGGERAQIEAVRVAERGAGCGRRPPDVDVGDRAGTGSWLPSGSAHDGQAALRRTALLRISRVRGHPRRVQAAPPRRVTMDK